MRWIIMLVAGFALGWFVRDLTFEAKPVRADAGRREARAPTTEPPPPPALPPATPEPSPVAEADTSDPEAGEETEAEGTEESPFGKMLRAQIPQMRAFASMQARQRGAPFLEALGFDEETTRKLIEMLAAAAAQQAERAFMAMLGDGELDASLFYWFQGLGPELPPGMESDLAQLLGDDGVADVREAVRKGHRKLVDDQIDMQIEMMGIDLSDDQRMQVRDVLAGHDKIREDVTRFGALMRDPDRLRRVLDGDGLEEEMERSLAPRRERMQRILNPTQFEQYRTYEKTVVEQARMGIKMWSGMLGRGKTE